MEQINLFEVLYEKYKIKNKIRLIELFGGIGSQAKALENLHADFEHYKLVEYDKYPVASYNAVHGTNFEPMDITKIHAEDLEIKDRETFTYLLTYSFPCQDLSLAGLGKGMKKGSKTRSGLLWEVERLLIECQEELPQVLVMENVPQVIAEKNKADFDEWVRFLEGKGYKNYYQILNAKDYGIPQNRQRCFMVSILGDAYYEFPKPQPLKLRLKDMLEPEEQIEEKYYLTEKMQDYVFATDTKDYMAPLSIDKEIASTINTKPGNYRSSIDNYITTQYSKTGKPMTAEDFIKNKNNPELVCVGSLHGGKWDKVIESARRVYSDDGISPTVTAMQGGNQEPKILIKNNTKQGYLEAEPGDGVDISSRMESHRGTVQKGMIQTIKAQLDVGVCVAVAQRGRENGQQIEISNREMANAITTVQKDSMIKNDLRIRKLTAKECWRLMGFDDEDYEKAAKVNSRAQLYKQAGNSIVVNVLMAIFSQML